MKFVEIINHKKFTLISIFLFLYVILNLLDGKRGLISYYDKKESVLLLRCKNNFHVISNLIGDEYFIYLFCYFVWP